MLFWLLIYTLRTGEMVFISCKTYDACLKVATLFMQHNPYWFDEEAAVWSVHKPDLDVWCWPFGRLD